MSTDSITKLYLYVKGVDASQTNEMRVLIVQKIFQDAEIAELAADSISLIIDKEYGGLKNFCFVSLPYPLANKAIQLLNESVTPEGYELSVSIAKPKNTIKPFNRSGGNSGGGNGGYSGNRDRDNNGGGYSRNGGGNNNSGGNGNGSYGKYQDRY